MGEFKENVKGIADEAIGNTKQVVGDVTNNESLENEGKLQETKGEAEYVKGDVEEAAGDDI